MLNQPDNLPNRRDFIGTSVNTLGLLTGNMSPITNITGSLTKSIQSLELKELVRIFDRTDSAAIRPFHVQLFISNLLYFPQKKDELQIGIDFSKICKNDFGSAAQKLLDRPKSLISLKEARQLLGDFVGESKQIHQEGLEAFKEIKARFEASDLDVHDFFEENNISYSSFRLMTSLQDAAGMHVKIVQHTEHALDTQFKILTSYVEHYEQGTLDLFSKEICKLKDFEFKPLLANKDLNFSPGSIREALMKNTGIDYCPIKDYNDKRWLQAELTSIINPEFVRIDKCLLREDRAAYSIFANPIPSCHVPPEEGGVSKLRVARHLQSQKKQHWFSNILPQIEAIEAHSKKIDPNCMSVLCQISRASHESHPHNSPACLTTITNDTHLIKAFENALALSSRKPSK